jgi:predicted nuclease with TOPRIM domain
MIVEEEITRLRAENERLAIEASKLRSANHTLEDIRELHTAEIDRLRDENEALKTKAEVVQNMYITPSSKWP